MYLNCGWCYGGFKATPASGWCFAWTIAKDEPHDFNAPFTLDRFYRGLVIDDKGQGASNAENGSHEILPRFSRTPARQGLCPFGKMRTRELSGGARAYCFRSTRTLARCYPLKQSLSVRTVTLLVISRWNQRL